MIRYHFDLYPRDDPRDGARVVRFTKLQSAEYRGEANGTGSGRFSIRADTAEAQNIDPAGLQYVRVVREDTVAETEVVVGGFFLDSGDFSALDERGTRLLTFGGAGTLSYLARAIMASHTYISPIFTGQDPFDDTWRLYAQSTVYANGNYLGAMLWRVIYEAQHNTPGTHRHADGVNVSDTHDDDRPAIAIPDLVMNFDQFEDSDGNAWAVSSGEFKAQVGENVLAVVKRLMEAGLYVEMDPDTFELNAYPASTHGRDRSGAAWGSTVVRFQAPTDGTVDTGNIKSDAKRAISAFIKRSWLLAGGQDTYGDATGTTDIPWEGFYYSDTADATALAGIAGVQIGARDDAGDTARLRIKLGTDTANGYYRPFEDILLDDLVTVHTGTGQWDWNEQNFPVAALTVTLRPGGDWDAWVDLGSSYSATPGRQFQVSPVAAHNHGPNPQLCDPAIPGSADTELYHLHWTDGATETVDIYPSGTADWPVNPAGLDTGAGSDGESGRIRMTIATTGTGSPALPCSAGDTIRLDFDTFYGGGVYLEFYDASDVMLYQDQMYAHTEGNVWIARTYEATAPANTAYMRFRPVVGAGYYDHVRITLLGTGAAGSNPLNGTSNRAKRCDSSEHEIAERAPGVTDDASHGYPRRTIWHDELTGLTWISLDATDGAAVWQLIGGTTETGGQIVIEEEDGTPSGTFDTLKVPNGRLTDNSDGSASLDLAASVHSHGSPAAGFHGVLVQRTTDFTALNSNDANPDFDTEVYDTDGAWTSGSPKIFTVPASWDGLMVQVGAWVGFESDTSGFAETKIYRNVTPGSISTTNDDKLVPGGVAQHYPAGGYNTFIAHTTAPFQVADGDTLTLAIKTAAGHDALAYEATSILFGMWIVEPGEGPAGEGVPAGGTAGQVLTKDSGTDYDTSWQDPTGGGGGRILLADGRSTPFTFNDLLQADDGSDFLWSD